jgi:hypothetical protein
MRLDEVSDDVQDSTLRQLHLAQLSAGGEPLRCLLSSDMDIEISRV